MENKEHKALTKAQLNQTINDIKRLENYYNEKIGDFENIQLTKDELDDLKDLMQTCDHLVQSFEFWIDYTQSSD